MAATWLLQAIYASLLSSTSPQGGSQPSGLLANTTYGTVQGFSDQLHGITVAKFLGIPFAKPPLGHFRFRPPVAPPPWTGIRDASRFGNSCLQQYAPDISPDDLGSISEDCLFLNVYTPDLNPQGLLPVMVWIHGGGYTVGSGSQYNADKLAAKGVVMVTINYRLDVMGFFTTGDDVAPGNYGMLDQVMALKWVQNNIQSFGGDPQKVTIFGESAGAGSVSLLTLSPLAKGLFQNAIMESGSSLSPWSIQQPALRSNAYTVSRLIATQVACDVWSGTAAMLDCLRKVDGSTLMIATLRITAILDSGIIMAPRVESSFGFLPDLPIQLLQQGKVNPANTIRGYNSDEMGEYVDTMLHFANASDHKWTLDDFELTLSRQLGMFALEDYQEVVTMWKNLYIGHQTDNDVRLRRIIDAADDLSFISGVILEHSLYTKAATSHKHFLYEFAKRSSFMTSYPDWLGAMHGEELASVFGFNPDTATYKTVDSLVMDLWTNFAKTGQPTSGLLTGGVTWAEYSDEVPNYLLINDTTSLRQDSFPAKLTLYKELLRRIDAPRQPSASLVG